MSQQIDSTQTPWGERRITGHAAVEEAVRTYYPADEALERLKNTPIPEAVPASRGRRAVGGLIDLTLLGLVEKGLAAFLVAGAGPLGPSPDTMELGALLITSVLAAGYFVGAWMVWGATLGMRIAGIYVADARTEGPLSGGQAWRRFLVLYVIGNLAFLVLLFSSDPKRQAWYDRAGGTVVLAR
ncbi:MAG TPA: RDD family protein [Candidatus Dormibacteraeota bacterium]|nr:RDD family protein [Candidatus Dormibacteraeota bacterium]